MEKQNNLNSLRLKSMNLPDPSIGKIKEQMLSNKIDLLITSAVFEHNVE